MSPQIPSDISETEVDASGQPLILLFVPAVLAVVWFVLAGNWLMAKRKVRRKGMPCS